MFKYSKYTLIFFFLFNIFIALSILLIIFISDPLKIYKPADSENDVYIKNARIAFKTMMKDHQFESVIIGSSYSENTSAKEASDLFNSKFLNLSMSAASPEENYILLSYILKNYKIKNVIYTLAHEYLLLRNDSHYPLNNWDFLYDDNPLNDIKVYFNDKYFFNTLLFKKKYLAGEKLDLDRPFAWYDDENFIARFGGFENWFKNKDETQMNYISQRILNAEKDGEKYPNQTYKEELKKYLYDNIISLAKKYPETNFYIIIPPVSELEMAIEIRADVPLCIESRFYGEKSLIELAQSCKNIYIYGFQDEQWIGKIENFKDLGHFHYKLNSYLLQSIFDNTHELTVNNIDDYHKRVKEISESVDFNYFKNFLLKKIHQK